MLIIRNIVFLFPVTNQFLRYYRIHPLRSILIVGLIFRLIAAVFSKGYAFTDDHYFVIEEAQQWIMQGGEERSFFNPNIITEDRLSHSSFYTFLHYSLFQFYRLIGFENPIYIMFSVRLMHAFYSLIIIYLGFKISRKLSNLKSAIQVSWMLAIAWFMPFLSVRNLVEVVCIPPLMFGTLLFLQNKRKLFLWAGIIFSVAFALRFQTVLFSGMFGFILLSQRKWKEALQLLFGFGLGSILFLGILDFALFKMPFHELISYIDYNMTHSGEYPNGPWYQYLFVILGMLLIFAPANWIYASVLKFKTYLILFLPTLIFLLFHSYFPNKQERFILPVIPFLIMGGILAWNELFPEKMKWNTFSMRFFWILNMPLLLALSLASTRTAKMDAMYYLFQQEDAKHFVIESSHKDYMEYMPRFYGQFWQPYQHILPNCDSECFFDSASLGVHPEPNYILFFDKENLKERVKRVQKRAEIERVQVIKSSWLDRLIPKLNPIVKSQEIYIYRVNGIRRALPTTTGTTSVESAAAAESAESS